MQSFASQRLAAIARELRAAGERDVRLGLTRGLRAAAAPVRDEVRAAALARLPKRGGLARAEAASVRVQVLTGARTATVRIRDTRRSSFQTDKGYLRHPTPELRGYDRSYWKWVEQEVPAATGWWSKTLTGSGHVVLPLIDAELNRVGRLIQSGGA